MILSRVGFACFLLSILSAAQNATLGLEDGFIAFDTPVFHVQLVKDSQTLYSLNASGFDFIPTDVMLQRQYNGNYHLGDITFRARAVNSSNWVDGDTSVARQKVIPLNASGSTVAAADLSPTLPSDSLLDITRRWVIENGTLRLLFDVANRHTETVQVGALGVPLEFNNIFTDKTAAEVNEGCSLFDPYIGQDAGYVQVTPLLGTLPPLIVTPVGQSPLEGWRFLPEDTNTSLAYQSQTFEGLFEWQFHTMAYAENEWASVEPWNSPTSFTLQPNQTRTYGLQFQLAPSIREIEESLIHAQRPVAIGIPGYILPADQQGKLFLNYTFPVNSITVYPSGALTWTTNSDAKTPGWVGYTLSPQTWGRARLSIAYEDGTLQTVHYYLTKNATQVISDLGNFLTTHQWYDNSSEPFRRSPSVISYDRSTDAPVKDDPRAWIPGLSDEAGAGSWLAAAMKQYAQPNADEVNKMETFIEETLWGSVQDYNGSVKKSVYFYQPDLVPGYQYPSTIDWSNWWSWNESESFITNRAYDYVHVTAAYWALYRVARNYPNLVSLHSWEWYLNRAVLTVLSMTDGQVDYVDVGLMEETVFRFLLDDLKREGMTGNASALEGQMRDRETIWAGERYPFGSEQAWDSTGQEGVYAWAKYFNDTTTAVNALNSIIAYDPLIPHWGYNGNARRYWDNIYGGKLMRIERQFHHYGSALNALPVVTEYLSSPDDIFLLRLGYAGLSGPLSNIDQDGFASASFHSWEDTLMWDAYSGDYGPNFVGHALGIGTFIIDHPDFGWQAFGGNVVTTEPTVQVEPRDSLRRRVFIAPLGAYLTLDAGAFATIEYNSDDHSVTVELTPVAQGTEGSADAPEGRLVITQTADVPGVGVLTPTTDLSEDAGAWIIPFVDSRGFVTLSSSP